MKIFSRILIIIFLFATLALPFCVFADSGSTQSGCTKQGNDTVCKLSNPLASNVTDVPSLVQNIIKALLGVIGSLSLLMFVWGGVTWLISAGNPERVKAGTQTMIWAAIGVVFVFISYILLNTIFTKLLSGG